MNEIILLLHVLLGVGCLLSAVWLFAQVRGGRGPNLPLERLPAILTATLLGSGLMIVGFYLING